MKYAVQVCGDGTSGWFELTVGQGVDAQNTGRIGVAFTAEKLQAVFDQMPSLHGQVTVTSVESARLVGPKRWEVEIPDAAGPLWVDGRHSAGSSGLTGMNSPYAVVLDIYGGTLKP